MSNLKRTQNFLRPGTHDYPEDQATCPWILLRRFIPGISSHRTPFLFTNNEIVQFWLPNLRLIARVLSEVTKGPEMNPL